MDTRLVIPMLLLVAATVLASSVGGALDASLPLFRVEIDILEGWLALTWGSDRAEGPDVGLRNVPEATRAVVIVGEDLDAHGDARFFWALQGAEDHTGALAFRPIQSFEAPGPARMAKHRMRVTAFALAEPLIVDATEGAASLAGRARDQALGIASWQAGAGWLEPPYADSPAAVFEDEVLSSTVPRPSLASHSADTLPKVTITR